MCALVGGIAVNIIPLSLSGGSEHIIFRLPSKKRTIGEWWWWGDWVRFSVPARRNDMFISSVMPCGDLICSDGRVMAEGGRGFGGSPHFPRVTVVDPLWNASLRG